MRYKPVKRVVTVEFVEEPRRGDYDIRITPEQIVVRYGDTIVWDVQGLPAGLATSVKVGAFLPLEVSPRIALRRRVLVPLRLRELPGEPIPVLLVRGHFQASLPLDNTDPGFYKYDIKFGDRTLRDPEIEIRGPKH
jgi:hypothetical protein